MLGIGPRAFCLPGKHCSQMPTPHMLLESVFRHQAKMTLLLPCRQRILEFVAKRATNLLPLKGLQ